MSFQIEKVVGNSGIEAKYWRILTGGWSFSNTPPSGSGGQAEGDPQGDFWFTIVGYRDYAARLDGLEPVPGAQVRVVMSYTDLLPFIAQAGGDFRKGLYLAAKTDPYFADAVDV